MISKIINLIMPCVLVLAVYLSGKKIGKDITNSEWSDRIEEMKKKVPSLVTYESSDGQDLILAADIAELINEFCGKESTICHK